jgi:hypothetical protein
MTRPCVQVSALFYQHEEAQSHFVTKDVVRVLLLLAAAKLVAACLLSTAMLALAAIASLLIVAHCVGRTSASCIWVSYV